MRKLVGVAFAIMVLAGCGGGRAQTAPPPPANSVPADCSSVSASVTRVLASKDTELADRTKADADVTKRCNDDRWTDEARTCFIAASSKDALEKCGYKNLTQEQQDKLDEATSGLASWSITAVTRRFVEFKDKMCKCKDAACAQVVSDEMTSWSQQMSKDHREPPKMTEAQTQRFATIGEEMGKCMQAAMGGPTTQPSAPVTVSSIEPAQGDVDGGTYVKITGTNFIADGARNAKVYFGSRQGTVVRFASDTELIVEAPGGKPNEIVDVLVILDPGGEMKLAQAFTFVDKAKKAKKKKKP